MKHKDPRGLLKGCLPALASTLVCLALNSPVDAQQCSSAPLCRKTAPEGSLLHNSNAKGNRVWTVACKGPNAPAGWSNKSAERLDKICQQITSCPAAGGFGKFLQAVTFDCKSKQFDGYFGLDGMTFGILDWTSNNLPTIIQLYQRRNKDKFNQTFGKLNLPIKNGCLEAGWVCDNNKQGKLICDTDFHDAFALSLITADFQKAQVDHALNEYENRLTRFKNLGLKTEYGNTAMAVVANNLVPTKSCRPETWKKTCAGKADETKIVQCMLEQYVSNKCRGSLSGSRNRADAINKVFAGAQPSQNIHPTVEAVTSCSDKWGTSNN